MSKSGLGLMLGLKLKDEKNLAVLIEKCLDEKLLVLKSGKDIVRFLPSLNISKKEIKEGFSKLQKAINKKKDEDEK